MDTETIKLFNRVRMMYGNCKMLSNRLIAVKQDDKYILFKVSGGGAKELASGYDINLYKTTGKSEGIIILENYNGKPLLLYTLAGEPWIIPECAGIYRISDGVFGIGIAPCHLKIFNNNEEQIVQEAIIATVGYRNGIVQLMSMDLTRLYSEKSNKVVIIDRLQPGLDPENSGKTANDILLETQGSTSIIVGDSLVYVYQTSKRFTDGTIGTVYDTSLNEYAKILAYNVDAEASLQAHLQGAVCEMHSIAKDFEAAFTLTRGKRQETKAAELAKSSVRSIGMIQTDMWNKLQSIV